MKKILSVLLCLTIALCFTACAGEKENKNAEKTSSPIVSTTKEAAKHESVKENKNLPNVYNVPDENIYINVPNWLSVRQNFTQLFIVKEEKCVAFTTDYSNPVATSKEAYSAAFDEFVFDAKNYCSINELDITEEKTETINGIEVYRYEGIAHCGDIAPYDSYIVGYSFVMDGIACNVTGNVIDRSQPQETIDEIEKLVDDMMKTLRSEE